MSKSVIIKILISGLVVFLLLPAVYEDDTKPTPKRSFEEAYDFAPAGYDDNDELPVLEGSNPKQSVFQKYSSRFKKMYGKTLFSSPKKTASKQATSEEDDESLYYAMAALFGADDSGNQSERSSYNNEGGDSVNAIAYSNSPAAYLDGSSAPVKQTMHDNAPVKGLYESSSVESYETRNKAKQVYSNVMNKVDKTIPARASGPAKNGAKAENEGEMYASANSAGGQYSGFDNANIEDDSSYYGGIDQVSSRNQKFNPTYTGIASRMPSRGGSNGSYGSYNNSSAGYIGGSGLGPTFEQAASQTENKVNIAAGIIKDENNSSGGSSNGNSGNSGSNTQPGNGSGPNQGQNGDGTGGSTEPGTPSEPTPTDPDKPGVEDPVKPPVRPDAGVLFDPTKYDLNDRGCAFPGDTPEKPEEVKPHSQGGSYGEVLTMSHGETCKEMQEWDRPIKPEVKERPLLVNLGIVRGKKGEQYVVTPTMESNSGKGLKQMGLPYQEGTVDVDALPEGFKGMPIREFQNLSRNKESIIMTSDPKEAKRYEGRSVQLGEGYTDTRAGMEKLSEALNSLPTAQEADKSNKEKTEADNTVKKENLSNWFKNFTSNFMPQTESK